MFWLAANNCQSLQLCVHTRVWRTIQNVPMTSRKLQGVGPCTMHSARHCRDAWQSREASCFFAPLPPLYKCLQNAPSFSCSPPSPHSIIFVLVIHFLPFVPHRNVNSRPSSRPSSSRICYFSAFTTDLAASNANMSYTTTGNCAAIAAETSLFVRSHHFCTLNTTT